MRLFALLVLLLPFTANARQEKPYYASNQVKDSAQVNAILERALELISSNRDSALYYTAFAYRSAESIGYKGGMARASQLLGTNEMHKGSYDRALDYYKISIRNYVAVNDQRGLAKTYMLAGINEGLQNNAARSLEWLLRSMKIMEALKDEAGIAELYYKIGLAYGQVNDFEKALDYQRRSMKFATEHGDQRLQMGVWTNMGMLYGRQREYTSALDALKNARNLSVALGDKANLAHVFLNIGNVYREMKKNDSSALYLRQALSLYEQAAYPAGMAGTYTAIADLKVQLRQYDSAFIYLDRSFPLVEGIGDQDLLYQNFLLQHAVYVGQRNYKAATGLFDTLMSLQQSVDNADKRALLVRTKMNDEMERKETAIKMLEAENQDRTDQRNILFIIAAVAACFTFSIIFILLQLRRKNRQLSVREKELEELNMVKDKLFSVISHDLRGPFTRIMGVLDLINTGALSEEEGKDVINQLQLSAAATLETLDNLLIWGTSQLRKEPPRPENVDLRKIVSATTKLYNHVAIHKSLRLIDRIGDGCVARFDRNQLEFIIRNLVANAIKFSYEGQQVTVECERTKDRIVLSVQDEGTGMSETARRALFNPAERKTTRGTAGESGVGLGLTLILDFLEQNSGSISVTSTEGKGSSFTIDVPAA